MSIRDSASGYSQTINQQKETTCNSPVWIREGEYVYVYVGGPGTRKGKLIKYRLDCAKQNTKQKNREGPCQVGKYICSVCVCVHVCACALNKSYKQTI